jgi:2-methylcitrate dehydratase PrpD
VDPFSERILIHDRPRNGQEARFSMQYCVAVAWLDGWPHLASFRDDRVTAEDARALVERVTLRAGSRAVERVVVHYADGTSDVETVREARGAPAHPLSVDDLAEKVARCVGDRPAVLSDGILRQAGRFGANGGATSVREFMELLGPDGPGMERS